MAQHTSFVTLALAFALCTAGCGNTVEPNGSGGSSTSSASSTAASTSSGGTGGNGASSSSGTGGTGGSAGTGGGCSGATPVALTVLNFESWCAVSVAGATFSGEASQTVCVADGSVDLVATPTGNTFKLGDWFGTSGDTGSGDPGTIVGGKSDAKVTVSGATAKCVSVCCPFTNGTGCPTTNPCP